MKAVKILGVSILFLAVAASAFGDTIAGNLGAGNSYAPSYVYTAPEGSSVSPDGQDSLVAVGFTPSENYTLSQILVAVNTEAGLPNTDFTPDAYVDLFNSDVNGLPGTALYTWFLTNLPSAFDLHPIQASQILTPVAPIPLAAGTTYWIVAMPYAPNTADSWNYNNTDETVGSGGLMAYFSLSGWALDSDSNSLVLAFEVDGSPAAASPAPEPASLLLFGTGLLGLGIMGRRRRASRCA